MKLINGTSLPIMNIQNFFVKRIFTKKQKVMFEGNEEIDFKDR